MKNSFIIAFILFCFVVSCKKESSNTNFEVRNQLGNIILDSKTIIALSPQSPLGLKLMGNVVGFSFEINGSQFVVETVE